MNKNWKMVSLNAIGFTILGAALFATLFALLGLARTTIDDLIFGASVGASSAMVTAVIVGLITHELMAQQKKASLTDWSIANAIIGAFTGAIVTTFAVMVMVSLTGFPVHATDPLFWAVALGRLIGPTFGMGLGLMIGASWQWLQLKTAA